MLSSRCAVERATPSCSLTAVTHPVLVRDGTTSTSAERNGSVIREFAINLGTVVDTADLVTYWQQPDLATTTG